MKISRALLLKARNGREDLMLLAIVLMLKHTLSKSRLLHSNINRLAKAAKVSHKTMKKYLPLLIMNGFIHIEGCGKLNNQIIIVNKIATKHDKQNISIDLIHYDSIQSVVKSLRAFMVVHLQSKKDYMKQLLETFHNPYRSDNYKEVRRRVRKLVSYGYLEDMHQCYAEWGLSIKGIAKRIGCSLVTAFKAVEYAISNGWLIKEKHVEQFYAKGVNHTEVEWATFTTKDNIYIVHPNTYSLTALSLDCFPKLKQAA